MLLFQVIFLQISIIHKDSFFQNDPFSKHLSSDQDYQQIFAFSKCSFSKSYFFRSELSIKIRFFKMLFSQIIFLQTRIINKDSLFLNVPFPNHLSSDQDYQQRFAFSKCSFSKSYFFRSGLSIKIRFFKMLLFQIIFLQTKIIDHGTAGLRYQ